MTHAEQPGYIQIHNWVRAQLGIPKECSACGYTSNNSRQFHWANISKSYTKDLQDWIRLCVPCHFAFDNEPRQFCVNQHALTVENTYIKRNKYVECKTCRKEQVRKFRRKDK